MLAALLAVILWQAPPTCLEVVVIDTRVTSGPYIDSGHSCTADTVQVNDLQITWSYCLIAPPSPSPWVPWVRQSIVATSIQ